MNDRDYLAELTRRFGPTIALDLLFSQIQSLSEQLVEARTQLACLAVQGTAEHPERRGAPIRPTAG